MSPDSSPNRAPNPTPASSKGGPFLVALLIGIIIGVVGGYPLGGMLPRAQTTVECAASTSTYLATISQQLEAGRTEGLAAELRATSDSIAQRQDPVLFKRVLDDSMDRLLIPE